MSILDLTIIISSGVTALATILLVIATWKYAKTAKNTLEEYKREMDLRIERQKPKLRLIYTSEDIRRYRLGETYDSTYLFVRNFGFSNAYEIEIKLNIDGNIHYGKKSIVESKETSKVDLEPKLSYGVYDDFIHRCKININYLDTYGNKLQLNEKDIL